MSPRFDIPISGDKRRIHISESRFGVFAVRLFRRQPISQLIECGSDLTQFVAAANFDVFRNPALPDPDDAVFDGAQRFMEGSQRLPNRQQHETDNAGRPDREKHGDSIFQRFGVFMSRLGKGP